MFKMIVCMSNIETMIVCASHAETVIMCVSHAETVIVCASHVDTMIVCACHAETVIVCASHAETLSSLYAAFMSVLENMKMLPLTVLKPVVELIFAIPVLGRLGQD